MKRNTFTLIMFLLVSAIVANANPVDLKTAREVALKFMNANTKTPLRGAQDLQLVKTYNINRGEAAFHVFNTPNGFVIVSADDCATPILGYSDEGRPFDIDDVPIQLQDLFNGYLEQFQYGIDNRLEATEAVAQQWRQVKSTGRLSNNREGDFVEPLLTTHWDQYWPWNDKCPIDGNGDRCLAGCVAVALGQIMKYHNWPPKGYGYVHYTLPNIPEPITANFDTTYYDWENMPEGFTTTGYESMAQLLADIGKSLFMEYSSGSSGTFSNAQTLADVFNYDYFSMRIVQRDHVDDSTWMAIIKNELNNGRPVDYSGYSNPDPTASIGHEFVCDGYDANDLFHMNFGWGGNDDGYFALSNITILFFGNFNYYQSALIGIQPAESGSTISGNETLSGNLEFDHALYCGAFSNVTVAPGTQLRFAPGKGMCVTGSLLADGTEENPILITAIDTAMGWGGLQIHPSMICYKMVEEPDTLSLNYTTISYASNDGIHHEWPNYYIYPATPDNVIHKGLILNHSKLAHNNGKGIAGERVLLKIDSCEISNNGDWGIHVDICGLDVSNSSIHHNRGAINQRNQSELFDRPSCISNNIIFQNTYGFNVNDVCIIEAFCDIIGNDIFGNYPLENDGALSARAVIRGGRIVGNSIHDNDCNNDNVLVLAGPIIGNKIYNNTGKAIFIMLYGVEASNNLIYNNDEGVFCSYANTPSYLYNNTIVNNNVGINYGYWGDGVLYLANNILWKNTEEINVHNCQLFADHNFIRGEGNAAYSNNGNSSDSLYVRFVDPDNGDFRLACNSACINIGTPDIGELGLPEVDLAGNPRVMDGRIDMGAYEFDPETECPEIITQTTTFAPGWTWWSPYVEQSNIDGLQLMEEELGANGLMIKSQTSFLSNNEGQGWSGSLGQIDNESGYMVNVSATTEVSLTGQKAQPANHPVTLNLGWSWIGYPCTTMMGLDIALSGLEATPGDMVKNQTAFAQYFEGYGWLGSLSMSVLKPGEGLMYMSVTDESRTFTYPSDQGRTMLEPESLIDTHWTHDAHSYRSNMTLTAVVVLDGEELRGDRYELAAFAGDGCRGSVRLMYVDPIDRHVAFLTVSGDEATELRFALYDAMAGEACFNSDERMTFFPDGIVGGGDAPAVIHFRSATGVGEEAVQALVYPNPTDGSVTVEATAMTRVTLTNTLGQVLYDADVNGDIFRLNLGRYPSGIYMLRIHTQSGTVVKKVTLTK